MSRSLPHRVPISLVFGSLTRGVELPYVNANFETNVPGIYIAGELGGMGLIRNAIEQGRQTIESIIMLVNIGSCIIKLKPVFYLDLFPLSSV